MGKAKAEPTIGHNGGPIMGEARDRLKAFFERLENLDDDAVALRESVKEVKAEMKASGFNPSAASKLVELRRKDRDKVIAAKETLELYAHALGVEDLV